MIVFKLNSKLNNNPINNHTANIIFSNCTFILIFKFNIKFN